MGLCACKTGQETGTSAEVDVTLAPFDVIRHRLAVEELTSEKLVAKSLERIAAYDACGPAINAMITIDERAIARARELDVERRREGPRGPLHGLPIILKDNYNTAGLPTTGGSAILANSRPSDDAMVVQRLRNAGAVILGKANMSEFALSYGWLGYGSAVGQTRNPHDPLRDPSGSSGGSAAAVAAGYATLATGTDSAGSIRGPAAHNGVVGIKPTMGLVSRMGIIPTSLSFDVPGPIARSVTGAAMMLEVMAGTDPADAVASSEGRSLDFQASLATGALHDVRLGVVRDFLGANTDVDATFASALGTLRERGAVLLDVTLPHPLENLWPLMAPVFDAEFAPQIEAYLANLSNGAPRTLDELIARAESPSIAESTTPLNPARVQGFRDSAAAGGSASEDRRRSLETTIPAVRARLLEILDRDRLDALVFPTVACPASPRHDVEDERYTCRTDDPYRPCYLASVSGYPEITVPAGFTSDGLPVGLSFLGRPYSEAELIGLAFDFEQVSEVRRVPAYTPSLETR